MCLLANRIFVLSSQKQLGIKLQTALRKDLSRGAYSAGARSALMRMRKQCIRTYIEDKLVEQV